MSCSTRSDPCLRPLLQCCFFQKKSCRQLPGIIGRKRREGRYTSRKTQVQRHNVLEKVSCYVGVG